MRIVFFGSPEISVPTLRALHASEHEIVLVITQKDRIRAKRGRQYLPTPVKAIALELGIRVSHTMSDIAECDADIGVLVAFGRIISKSVLDSLTILNIHPSLLPRWRGATPVEAAILHGDNETGVSIMKLVEEMDAGPVYATATKTIAPLAHADEIYRELFATGNEMLLGLLSGKLPTPQPQTGLATYCGKRTKSDARVDWTASAEVISRTVRVGDAWTTFHGKRIRVLSAIPEKPEEAADNINVIGSLHEESVQCGSGRLRLLTLQAEGKRAIAVRDWLNGVRSSENTNEPLAFS